jgi:hypothetical protein
LQVVPRELAEHALHVRPDAKPVKQPLRRNADDRRKAIWEEVARLLASADDRRKAIWEEVATSLYIESSEVALILSTHACYYVLL